MFDKDLFLSLCEKYDVELSVTATSPMIKEGEQAHAITLPVCDLEVRYNDNKSKIYR